MKKILNKISILVAATSFVLPTTACTFDSYVNVAKQKIIDNFANQTSSILKSLVLSKKYGFNTKQTINDIFNSFSNFSINNNSSNNLTNLNDFKSSWGYNRSIKTNIDNTYFITNSSISNKINTYNNINSILSSSSYILGLGVANNPLLVNLLQYSANAKNAIFSFFQETQKNKASNISSSLKPIILLLKNMLVGQDWTKPHGNQFTNNLITPLSDMFDYLINGWWGSQPNLHSNPTNSKELAALIPNWNDYSGTNYCQNYDTNNKKWTYPDNENLNSNNLPTNWTQSDCNLYRSGVLLNYLFFKIGTDNGINYGPQYPPYLGTVLLQGFNNGGFSGILPEIKRFLPYIIQNPYYLLTAINAVLPLLKDFITDGKPQDPITNLTFGKIYPSIPGKGTYNIGSLINKIANFFNSSDWVEKITNFVLNIIGLTNADQHVTPILSEITISFLETFSLPDLTNFAINTLGLTSKNDIKNKITGLFIDPKTKQPTALSNEIVGAVDSVKNVYDQWIKQYNDNGTGININLKKLQDYLLNPANGLLNIINRDVIKELYNIFTTTSFKESDYEALFTSIGIQFPTTQSGTVPNNFKSNSTITTLLNGFNDGNNPIRQLITILLGSTNPVYKGLRDYIISNINDWIDNNYNKYFDSENLSLGKVNNAKMQEINNGNNIQNQLQYNFAYTINNKTYKFYVVCTSSPYEVNNPPGQQNFKFNEIDLLSTK